MFFDDRASLMEATDTLAVPSSRLGEAALPEMIAIYHLLGDPAMTIQ